ncbi:hypothetical protein [Corynebacterium alimapuense]|uniref:Glycosyltransferase RgtA/B/C/D-like domain-containing protein n=1 Tax=Corynebacterium alimapuense TaxID=1576874 RepID=A0A3M8K7U3_9CORY|nr:hypothetical protein [Corynebacterium alimapuense]RNE48584.1 hypothetical protein C5L39_08830 [Corynebacterium alimapuense]
MQLRSSAESTRTSAVILSAIVVFGVSLRTAVAAQGWFYWDDLTLYAQARSFDSPSVELLLRNHDGHLMPGAWLIEWILATFAPLNWPVAVAVLALLQLSAAASVAWLSWVLCARAGSVAPWAALPLSLYLLTPLTLPSTTWLATAVNTMPLHAAIALTLAHCVLALRSRTPWRHLTIAALALSIGLLFSERALFAGPIVVAMLVCFCAASATLRSQFRAIARIAVVLAIPTVTWAGVYFATIGDPRTSAAGESTFELFTSGYLRSLLPTVAGGPWHWERWHPSPPWAEAPVAALVLGALAVVGIAIWTARRRVRDLVVWLPVVCYPVMPLLALALARSGPSATEEITQTLRHFSEVAVLAAAATAFLLSRPTPEKAHPLPRPIALSLGSAVAAAYLVSTAISTISYAHSWSEQPAREYFHTLREELTERAEQEEPILDQAVALDVLLPVVYPDNMLSRLIGGLDDVPEIGDWTTDPVLIDGEGTLIPSELMPLRATVPGTQPDCGVLVGPEGESIALDGPLLGRDWVVRFNYFADQAGTVSLALDGEEVEVPVQAGLSQLHVHVLGGGQELRVTPGGGINQLCVGRSEIGLLAAS